MSELGDDVYSVKMTQTKLKEEYNESMRLVTREGKSNIILLDRTAEILCEKWYKDRKSDVDAESEHVIKTAAALIKGVIKNHELETRTYPSMDDITMANNQIPNLLAVFIDELVRSPIKQMSISQALVAATRPRTIMPLQFGLAVCADNRIGSIWLNTVLSNLGFAVSYDEVIRFKQNVVKHDVSEKIICPEGTSFLQFVADNTDHDLATPDGKNTHHGLGSIAIANGNFAITIP
eukprot:gene2755-3185_t